MENYKIKVNDEAESKEAQELFFELGYNNRPNLITNKEIMNECGNDYKIGHLYAEKGGWISCTDIRNNKFFYDHRYKEITLPQLRDLVVLHRNDVNDATHIDKYGTSHVDINGQWYFWSNNKEDEVIDYGWNESASSREFDNRALKPIQPEPEQGLISGAEKTIKVNGLDFLIEGKDALRSAIDGNDIQLSLEPWEVSSWSDFNPVEDEASTKVFFTGLSSDGQKVFFRLKPHTIKLELEIPAPFEPKEKDIFWALSTNYDCGYVKILCYRNDEQGNRLAQFGAWRTEEEIKQVVAALRNGLKGVNQ